MLKLKKQRPGRWYSRRKHFAAQRNLAISRNKTEKRDACEVCEANLTVHELDDTTFYIGVADHIIPERFVRRFYHGADPHILENLAVICPSCHGKKTKAERWLFSGDWLSFKRALDIIGYSIESVRLAMLSLEESAKR